MNAIAVGDCMKNAKKLLVKIAGRSRTYIKRKAHISHATCIINIFEGRAGETIAIRHISTFEVQQLITSLSRS